MTQEERQAVFDELRVVATAEDAPEQVLPLLNLMEHVVELLELVAYRLQKRGGL
jgi:hypothetical protein